MPTAANRDFRGGGIAVDSIKDRVAIVGMGCVKFGENWAKSLEDMIVDEMMIPDNELVGIDLDDDWQSIVDTITRSPGLQSAGRATEKASAACRAITTLYNSSKFRPRLSG